MPEDIAILVIHGIGQQHPYETLDHFTLGLEKTFSAAGLEPRLEVCQDPLREQKQWVRADCVMTLPGGTTFESDQSSSGTTIGSISFFEYYWAPVTQDKVTYRGSLWFLIQAGLTPFKYLATNITVLSATNRRKRIPLVILKELWRQAALFLPLLAFFALVLAFLTQYSNPHTLLRLYRQVPSTSKVLAAILVIRYLYLWTTANALLESFRGKNTWQSSWWWRLALSAGLLVHIVLWPLWISAALRGIAWFGTNVAHWMPILPRILGHWSGQLRDLAAWTQPAFGGGWPFVKDLVFLKPSFSHYSYLWVVAFAVLAYWVRFILVDYVGDLAVYTNTSELAKNFAARAQILDECAGVLSQILRRRQDPDDPTSQYVFDRVLIAAHSLGSVIAYDTINEVLNRCRASVAADPKALQPEDLRKLCGLVTFGCPLNKIFYFFREKMPPDQELRRQILDLLRGFRLMDVLRSYPPDAPGPGGPMSRNLDPRWAEAEQHLDNGFRWINAWAPADPVSGRLAFHDLQGDANQKRFNYGPWNFGRAHMLYWTDPDFYSFIRDRLL
jgi:hypothetical protein